MEQIQSYYPYCRYFRANAPGDVDTCSVYPDGIPREIIEVAIDQRLPFEGDGGIRFEWRISKIKGDPLYIFGPGAPGTFDTSVEEARR